MDVDLYRGSILVGQIAGVFYSDNTGYGLFHSKLLGDDPAVQRIREYISFSEEWNSREGTGQPTQAEEWEAFRDVFESKDWCTVSPDGVVVPIEGPVFIEGEVTWRPA